MLNTILVLPQRVTQFNMCVPKKKFWHFPSVWILGNSTCQPVLVKDQEAVSSFRTETARIVFLYSSPVVNILTETVGDSHSIPSFF